ncbi:Trp operon leader peptide [Vibrio japonicus]|uniref:Trp operon leader peptide n=1 Tax=Vibrio japonicus TaxID=1824638 RepID=A0ABY5LHV0_9VIBR|nr:Trp operon leader peptide [Vibrio japonicus]UUM31599.1 Trp operon leader peptide [Vibrio japonicus]
MLQETNQNQNVKVAVCSQSTPSTDLSWWRTWASSWWANVYF